LFSGQRDYILLIFIIGGTYFFAKYVEANFKPFYLIVAGLFLGAGAAIKPFAVILFLFFLLMVTVYTYRSGGRWLVHGALSIAGFCLLPGLCLLWLWKIGGLKPFFDIAFNYALPLYSQITFVPKWTTYKFFSAPVFLGLGLIIGLGLTDIIIQRKVDVRQGLLLLGIVYGIIHFIAQGHLYYQLYPAILFAFLMAASWIKHSPQKKHKVLYMLMMFVIMYASLELAYHSVKQVIVKPPAYYSKDYPEFFFNRLVNHLKGRVPPSDTVQIMENTGGGIHALLKLHYRQPTRFLHDAYLFYKIDHPYVQKLRREFLHDLKQHPPLFLVITKTGWPINGYERLKTFPELHKWIHDNYVIETEAEKTYRMHYRIYRKKQEY
jgi:hypothetical protein